MKECPYCNSEVNEDFNFCPQCTKQIKCTKCGKLLGRSPIICPYCGVNLKVEFSNQSLNEYSFSEEKKGEYYKRHITLKASDNAVAELGALIINNSQPMLADIPRISVAKDKRILEQNEERLLPTPTTEKKEEYPVNIPTNSDEPFELVKDYVFPLDDALEVKLTDFLGKSHIDNQRRFILLYVGGYQYHFPGRTPNRNQIIEKAKHLNLHNSNFSYVVTNLGKKYLIESVDSLKLSPPGKQEVNKIINELVNAGETATSSNHKQSRKNNRRKSKPTNEVEQIVNQWIDSLGELRDFDARELQNAATRQKLQFGLWILKRTSKIGSVPLSLLIHFILTAYPTIGSTKEALRKSFEVNNYFSKTGNGEIFLTKAGEADIEQLLPESIKS